MLKIHTYISWSVKNACKGHFSSIHLHMITICLFFLSLISFSFILPTLPTRTSLHPPWCSHEQHNHLRGPHGRAFVSCLRKPATHCALAQKRRSCGTGAAAGLLQVHAVWITPPHPQPGHYWHGILPMCGHQQPGLCFHHGCAVCQVRWEDFVTSSI